MKPAQLKILLGAGARPRFARAPRRRGSPRKKPVGHKKASGIMKPEAFFLA
jgi:hypothetical protein